MDLSTYLERLIERFVSKDPCRQRLKTEPASSPAPSRPACRRSISRWASSHTLVSQPDGIRYVIKVLGLSYDGSADGSTSG